jgi:hypothetical protein
MLKSLMLALFIVCTFGVAQAQAQSASPDFPLKVCSVLEPGNWRANINVGPGWLSQDCAAFALSVGASHYQLGCIYSNRRNIVNQRFTWGAVFPVGHRVQTPEERRPVLCGWFGDTYRTGGESYQLRVCSAIVPGNWRTMVAVGPVWLDEDCARLARSLGATRHEVGCIYDSIPTVTEPAFVWSRRGEVNTPTPRLRRCGWRQAAGSSPQPNSDYRSRICSAVTPDNWRAITPVAPTWEPADCASYASSVGASHYQLGCILDDKRVNELISRWGPVVPVARTTQTADERRGGACLW